MSNFRIADLRCEYLFDPLGIDERVPRLSWRIESDLRGARQVAYQLLVASSAERLANHEADRWDSGQVLSNQTTHIAYAGLPLCSRDRCYWQVRVWPAFDSSTEPLLEAPLSSTTALWTMGLLERSDWSASWITADSALWKDDPTLVASTLDKPGTPAIFRREFDVPGTIDRATLYASARGLFELRANGQRISDDLFTPEWTDYDKRIHFRTYDVTKHLKRGANCLAATLGDGWWSGFVGWQEQRGRYGSLENSLIVQLEVELIDGSCFNVCSDRTWSCQTGPILSSDFMMGEIYDARRKHLGWDQAIPDEQSHFAAQWLPAREVAPPPAQLVAQRSEPVRIVETIEPTLVGTFSPQQCLYDCRQNISGWIRLQCDGLPAGTTVTLQHGERLTDDGTLYTENLRRAKATDVFIADGVQSCHWQPHFTFHGFQYFKLSFSPPLPPHAQVIPTACVIHSATPPAGYFDCSHPGVNRLWQNGLWSQKDNFISVPTDCPQRDERLGWMGDAQVFLRTATCNMNVAAFFSKWMIDVQDGQTSEGLFPDTAPRLREDINFVGLDDLCGAAGWADAGIIIPWTLWQVYGDCRIVERHWLAMTSWMDYLERTNPDHLRTRDLHNNYGDWLCLPTDTRFRMSSPMKDLLATAYWANDAAKMADMASALGKASEAARFRSMFESVRLAFQKHFIEAPGRLTVATQTAYLLALAFDLIPAENRDLATTHLVSLIQDRDGHLATGFIGVSLLNPVLTLNGHADLAYQLLLQDSFPSWLHPVKHGATTIWERWNGWTPTDGFADPQMNSFNHYALGSVGEWLFRHVAGIDVDRATPGFQHFILCPFLGNGLNDVNATQRTLHGEIKSHWQIAHDRVVWNLSIPANTQARVGIPVNDPSDVMLDGVPMLEHATRITRSNSRIWVTLPAGQYTCDFRMSPLPFHG